MFQSIKKSAGELVDSISDKITNQKKLNKMKLALMELRYKITDLENQLIEKQQFHNETIEEQEELHNRQIKLIKQIVYLNFDTICQLEQQAVKEKLIFTKHLEKIQNENKQKVEENTQTISNLQQELEGRQKQDIQRQMETMKINPIDLEMEANIPKTLDEVITLLENYQDNVNQLAKIKNDLERVIQGKQKQTQIFKNKENEMAKKMQECEASLETASYKLQEKENELNKAHEKYQKDLQIITCLKNQIKSQKKELEEYKRQIKEVQIKLQESEKQNDSLQKIIDSQKNDLEKQKQETQKIESSLRDYQEVLEFKLKNALENQIKNLHQLNQIELQNRDNEIENLKKEKQRELQNVKTLIREKEELQQKFKKSSELMNQIGKFEQSLEKLDLCCKISAK